MSLRRAFYAWLLPSAFVLPVWLLVGWGVFQAGGWAFLWVLFIAVPSVFVGQLLLAMLVRSRPSVRAERAVSWWDVAGFSVWHALTIVVGCFPQGWFPLALTGAIAAALAVFWLSLRQLWNEARGGRVFPPPPGTSSSFPGGVDGRGGNGGSAPVPGVIIVEESDRTVPR